MTNDSLHRRRERQRLARDALLRRRSIENQLAALGETIGRARTAEAQATRGIGELLTEAWVAGIPLTDTARLTGLSRPTLYRLKAARLTLPDGQGPR